MQTPDHQPTVPSFLGVRNEAVRDDQSIEKTITIQVQGLKGIPNGEYRLGWVEGTPLKLYLDRLKLKSAAIRSAVRDITNPEVGRIRMHYVPKAGAVITIGNPSVSSALVFQRSNHDAQQLARNMGGGARVVEVPLRRR